MAYLGVPQSKLENLTTNVQIVNLSASFDGTAVTFNLQDSRGDAVYAVHERALLVTLGGITQKPGVDYTTSGTTITFTTAPVSNLTIEIRKFYGVQRIIGVNDGVISPIKLSTGGPVWNSSGNVTINGDLNITGSFNAGTNGLFWEDNERAKFGADNDLEIYHSGANSFIRDSGTGSLFIEGTDLTLRAANSTTRYLVANESNGDVSLFFGNNKKFETTAQGISVTGDINGTGNFILTSTNVGSTAAPEIDLFRNSTSPADADYIGQIKFTGKQDGGGTVNYAKITGKILDASNGTEDGIIEFMLRKAGSNNIAARFRSDSLQLLNGTGLTVNGGVTFDTSLVVAGNLGLGGQTSPSSTIHINNFGNDGYELKVTGNAVQFNRSSNSYIDQVHDTGSILFRMTSSNSTKLRINADGTIKLPNDNQKLTIGSSEDLQVYHDGTDTWIDNDEGDLYIRNTGDDIIIRAADDVLIQTQASEGAIIARGDGTVELYHNNSKKLETTTTGVTVTGSLTQTTEYPSIRPTLDLNFAATKTLDRRITFTRDSIGTYIGENGLVKYASNNVPRFDHDPTTGESLGLLIEESRTNKISYSTSGSGLNNAPYYGNWNAAPYTDNFAVGPDGTTTAWKMSPNTPSSSRVLKIGATAGITYTFSVWLKKDPAVSVSDGVWNYFKFFIAWSANGSTVTSATTQQLVSGSTTSAELTTEWRRFSVSYIAPANMTSMEFGLTNANSGSGNPGYSVFVWGAQIEQGFFATSYIPTNGSEVTRAQDTPLITGTNFTDFYNQSEGTLVLSADIGYTATSNQAAVAFEDTSNVSGTFIAMGYNTGGGGSGTAGAWYNSSGTTSAFASHNTGITINTEFKQAYAYKLNDFSSVANGSTPITDTSGGLTSLIDRVRFGIYHYDGMTSGHIRQFKYYNKRLPNAQLQGLTQQ